MTSPLDLFLLHAYLDGDMDAACAEAFETRLLEEPGLADLVDADNALRIGMAASHADHATAGPPDASGHVVPVASTDVVAGAAAVRLARVRPRFTWPAAVAAVLAAAIGTLAGYRAHRLPDIEHASLAYVDRYRDVAGMPEIRLPTQGVLVLMVPVAHSPDCDASILVSDSTGRSLRTQARPDPFGYASVVVAGQALRAGAGTIEVHCDGSRTLYPVRLVR